MPEKSHKGALRGRGWVRSRVSHSLRLAELMNSSISYTSCHIDGEDAVSPLDQAKPKPHTVFGEDVLPTE